MHGSPEHESGRHSRILSALLAAGPPLLVALVLYLIGFKGTAVVAAVVGGAIGLLTLVSPQRIAPRIRGALRWLGRLCGQALTWILLVPFYYLLIVPLGWLLRAIRGGSMVSADGARRESYWRGRDGKAPDPASYRQQF